MPVTPKFHEIPTGVCHGITRREPSVSSINGGISREAAIQIAKEWNLASPSERQLANARNGKGFLAKLHAHKAQLVPFRDQRREEVPKAQAREKEALEHLKLTTEICSRLNEQIEESEGMVKEIETKMRAFDDILNTEGISDEEGHAAQTQVLELDEARIRVCEKMEVYRNDLERAEVDLSSAKVMAEEASRARAHAQKLVGEIEQEAKRRITVMYSEKAALAA